MPRPEPGPGPTEGKAGADGRESLPALLDTVEPPLRYLASARPVRLAPDAIPKEAFLRRIDRWIATAPDHLSPGLQRIREVFAEIRPDEEDRCRRLAREGLEQIGTLRRAVAGDEPERPAVVYRRNPERVAEGIELLRAPAQYVKGVGPRRAEQLERIGVSTVEDLVYHLPFRYEDRRSLEPVGRLEAGQEATTVVEIVAVGERRAGRRGRRLLEARASDGTGGLNLTWFHQIGYFTSKLRPGVRAIVHGRLQSAYGRRQMIHPDLEILEGSPDELGRVLPVYTKPGALSVQAMRKIVSAAFESVRRCIPSVIPEAIARRRGLLDLETAFAALHDPSPEADVAAMNVADSVPHRSVIYDELFFLQLGMGLRRQSIAEEPGIPFRTVGLLERRLRDRLPFRLTAAQERVLRDIRKDMARSHPMNRLVQGDVGSGKTIVALLAALAPIELGYQVALMAPTEILAEQHFRTVSGLLEPLGVRSDLLTGRVQGAARRRLYERVATGETAFLVGTQAIIQEGLRFARLGLGIIDEQHRFGVLQRKALMTSGENADVLLMTATPIPRTLGLTLYGDLDLSFIDELPPGREPVKTRVRGENDRERIYAGVRRELDRGQQAYLVFPLVEESDGASVRSAKVMARDLATGPFEGYRLGLLHGQMRGDEKDAVMRRFQSGQIQALVATTVIEVGVDVPSATVMVIDHAEQFGLAQLHQLRGRVGRGSERSYCVLVASSRTSPEGFERLKVLERESRGLDIAEADLFARGPGHLLGLRQSGMPDFRAANLLRDVGTLQDARRDALEVLEADPGLRSEASEPLRRVLEHRWRERLGWVEVG